MSEYTHGIKNMGSGSCIDDVIDDIRVYSLNPREPKQPKETKEMIELSNCLICIIF